MSRKIDLNAICAVAARRAVVQGVWIFGSAESGEVETDSDLDLGVLFSPKADLGELSALRAELQSALHFDEIDLVVLNSASPILRFEALSGRCLFRRDMAAVAAFAARSASEYEDSLRLIEVGMQAVRERSAKLRVPS